MEGSSRQWMLISSIPFEDDTALVLLSRQERFTGKIMTGMHGTTRSKSKYTEREHAQ